MSLEFYFIHRHKCDMLLYDGFSYENEIFFAFAFHFRGVDFRTRQPFHARRRHMLLSPTDSPPPDASPPVQILFCRRRLRPIFSRGRRRCPFRTLSIDSSSPETDSNASFIFRFLDFRKADFRCDFLVLLLLSDSISV